MGVVTHRTSGEEEKIYRRSQDGRGILVQLKSSRTPVSNKSIANHSSGAEGADSGEAGKAVRRRTAGSIKEQTQIIDNGNGTTSTTTLRNRLTQAASQLVEGIRHSADDIIHNDSVLSTSPNDEGNHINQRRHTKKPTLTTIAIECQQCGSDTRAEAGARAYVKGPEPLSMSCKKRMDLTNCKELAYSEIRAAREAECGNSLTAYTQLICVKDKATVATKNMFPDEGRACVCNVFDEAMNDHTPFVSLQSHSRNPHRASDR
ncbi:hypothetical protein QTG54_003514 [Skeletonema marinoi]|uniref:Uncharacterized protein n=1 Tax=Skeletonema marinoi TaxID=267567 RepID=A0AAD9DH32_9STRA|nr:hypothetical protein QTG54_003514 [Skeletonema marinoi]